MVLLENIFQKLSLQKQTSIVSIEESVTSDFTKRDLIPQSQDKAWGPHPTLFDPVQVPSGFDPINWKQQRILAVAKHYIGVPYIHHHIPALGLDCSNFTAWVYNYGLGIHLNSNVHTQSMTAGTKLENIPSGVQAFDAPFIDQFQTGDLLYIYHVHSQVVGHVIMFIDSEHVIDCTIDDHDGVWIRPIKNWYKQNFAWARRIIQ